MSWRVGGSPPFSQSDAYRWYRAMHAKRVAEEGGRGQRAVAPSKPPPSPRIPLRPETSWTAREVASPLQRGRLLMKGNSGRVAMKRPSSAVVSRTRPRMGQSPRRTPLHGDKSMKRYAWTGERDKEARGGRRREDIGTKRPSSARQTRPSTPTPRTPLRSAHSTPPPTNPTHYPHRSLSPSRSVSRSRSPSPSRQATPLILRGGGGEADVRFMETETIPFRDDRSDGIGGDSGEAAEDDGLKVLEKVELGKALAEGFAWASAVRGPVDRGDGLDGLFVGRVVEGWESGVEGAVNKFERLLQGEDGNGKSGAALMRDRRWKDAVVRQVAHIVEEVVADTSRRMSALFLHRLRESEERAARAMESARNREGLGGEDIGGVGKDSVELMRLQTKVRKLEAELKHARNRARDAEQRALDEKRRALNAIAAKKKAETSARLAKQALQRAKATPHWSGQAVSDAGEEEGKEGSVEEGSVRARVEPHLERYEYQRRHRRASAPQHVMRIAASAALKRVEEGDGRDRKHGGGSDVVLLSPPPPPPLSSASPHQSSPSSPSSHGTTSKTPSPFAVPPARGMIPSTHSAPQHSSSSPPPPPPPPHGQRRRRRSSIGAVHQIRRQTWMEEMRRRDNSALKAGLPQDTVVVGRVEARRRKTLAPKDDSSTRGRRWSIGDGTLEVTGLDQESSEMSGKGEENVGEGWSRGGGEGRGGGGEGEGTGALFTSFHRTLPPRMPKPPPTLASRSVRPLKMMPRAQSFRSGLVVGGGKVEKEDGGSGEGEGKLGGEYGGVRRRRWSVHGKLEDDDGKFERWVGEEGINFNRLLEAEKRKKKFAKRRNARRKKEEEMKKEKEEREEREAAKDVVFQSIHEDDITDHRSLASPPTPSGASPLRGFSPSSELDDDDDEGLLLMGEKEMAGLSSKQPPKLVSSPSLKEMRARLSAMRSDLASGAFHESGRMEGSRGDGKEGEGGSVASVKKTAATMLRSGNQRVIVLGRVLAREHDKGEREGVTSMFGRRAREILSAELRKTQEQADALRAHVSFATSQVEAQKLAVERMEKREEAMREAKREAEERGRTLQIELDRVKEELKATSKLLRQTQDREADALMQLRASARWRDGKKATLSSHPAATTTHDSDPRMYHSESTSTTSMITSHPTPTTSHAPRGSTGTIDPATPPRSRRRRPRLGVRSLTVSSGLGQQRRKGEKKEEDTEQVEEEESEGSESEKGGSGHLAAALAAIRAQVAKQRPGSPSDTDHSGAPITVHSIAPTKALLKQLEGLFAKLSVLMKQADVAVEAVEKAVGSALALERVFVSELTCLACLEPMEDPVILTKCGHTYCKRCAQHRLSPKHLPRGITTGPVCPACAYEKAEELGSPRYLTNAMLALIAPSVRTKLNISFDDSNLAVEPPKTQDSARRIGEEEEVVEEEEEVRGGDRGAQSSSRDPTAVIERVREEARKKRPVRAKFLPRPKGIRYVDPTVTKPSTTDEALAQLDQEGLVDQSGEIDQDDGPRSGGHEGEEGKEEGVGRVEVERKKGVSEKLRHRAKLSGDGGGSGRSVQVSQRALIDALREMGVAISSDSGVEGGVLSIDPRVRRRERMFQAIAGSPAFTAPNRASSSLLGRAHFFSTTLTEMRRSSGRVRSVKELQATLHADLGRLLDQTQTLIDEEEKELEKKALEKAKEEEEK